MNTAAPQSAWLRWRMVVLLMALCFISHLNRIGMSVAADERIMKQYSISPKQMGYVYSAFLLVYTICMIPGGFFIDRFGPRIALMVVGFGSAMFGALTGVVGLGFVAAGQGWLSLMIVRSLMGFFTTPLHPACARLVSNWVPAQQRTLANGLITGAALLGIASTYKIFGALIDKFDWPNAFLITGGCTMLLTVVWSFCASDFPREHRAADPAEGGSIRSSVTPHGLEAVADSGGSLSLLRNRSLILLTLSYAAIGYFQYLFFYWIHYYFETILQFGKETSRLYAGIPTFAMAVAMPVGGLLSDRLQQAYGRRTGLRIVPAGGMLASALFLGLGLVAKEPAWIVTWFALSMAAVGLSEGPFWLTAVELGGRRGGTAAAIINTGGNGIGLLAPIITPLISGHLGWQWGISLGGVICILGALCWWGIDVTNGRTESGATQT